MVVGLGRTRCCGARRRGVRRCGEGHGAGKVMAGVGSSRLGRGRWAVMADGYRREGGQMNPGIG